MENIGEVFDRKNLKSQSKYIRTKKRILIKENISFSDDLEKGFITSIIGKNFYVEANKNSKKVICEVSGVLESQNIDSSILAVGDIVYFRRIKHNLSNDKYDYGTIHKVEERTKWISRTSVINPQQEQVISANIQQVMMMFSLKNPKYNKRLVDRFLVSAEIGFLKPILILNKIDLFEKDNLDEILEDFKTYKKMKITIVPISALQKINVDKVKNLLKGKKTILLGPSGVGKSSLLNTITGQQLQKIKEISDLTSKGKHTTSSIIMFNIPTISKNTYLIDTPGIREWGIAGIDKQDLSFYFHDFDKYYNNCKYIPCSHTHEPECAVKEAVEKGKIDYERYISYLNIYDTMN